MGDRIPIGLPDDLLLPAEVRIELCITGLTVKDDGRLLRFRLDPGRAFERHAFIRDAGHSWYSITIRERYRPGDRPAEVSGAFGMIAAEVPDELRGAAGRAHSRTAALPHWREAFEPVTPAAVAMWRDKTGLGAELLTSEAIRRARQAGITLFVYSRVDRYECANNPPPGETAFFSVTPQGDWSVHRGTDTYPMELRPNSAHYANLTSGTARYYGTPETDPARVRSSFRQARAARRDWPDMRPQIPAPDVQPPRMIPIRPARNPSRDQKRRAR